MKFKHAIHMESELPHVGTGLIVPVCRFTNARVLTIRWENVTCPRCLKKKKGTL